MEQAKMRNGKWTITQTQRQIDNNMYRQKIRETIQQTITHTVKDRNPCNDKKQIDNYIDTQQQKEIRTQIPR